MKSFFILSALLLMASCSGEIPEVLPDGSSEINVSVGRGIATRAADGYRDWSADTAPTTLGVIAFTDGNPSSHIYNNVSFSAPTEGTGAWDIAGGSQKAKWKDYTSATALDFIGYMPYQAGATVSKSESAYTLTLHDVPGISTKPYLVVTTPVRYVSALGNLTPVPLQMDQLMTAFEFRFALDENMSDLRTFVITNVKMSEVPASATVAQAYTLAEGTWTKGVTTLSDIATGKTSAEVISSEGIRIGYNNPTAYKSFPSMLYMLPFNLSEVTPKIEVTYDVYDEDGYKTRSTTSTILLNPENFGSIGIVESAHKNIINIKIVPNQLHILSDADQRIGGYLVVE